MTAIDLSITESQTAALAALKAKFIKEGLSEKDAEAKAAESEKSAARKAYIKSTRSAAIMLSWQASGAATMYEIAQARYADGR